MKAGWQAKSLGEVATVGAGNSAPQGDELFKDGEYPFFRTSDAGKIRFGDIYEASDKLNEQGIKGLRLFPKGTILFPKSGASTFLNHRVMLGVDGYVSSHLATIVADKSKVHERFLLYFLTTISAQDLVQDHAYPSLNLPIISAIQLPYPPLPEQQRIVTMLDQAFEGIATATANAEKNLANAREIFEGTLQSIFTHKGEGWVQNANSLADLCELIVDCEHKTAPTQAEGIPSIRTPNIGKGKLLLDGVYRVSDETYLEWARRAEPRAGDLILAREAPAGNVAVIPENLKVCLGQRTVLIRPKQDVFVPEFLALMLLQPQLQRKLLAHSRGATVQHVNMKDIRALHVGDIPTLKVQREIVAFAGEMTRQAERLEAIYQQKLVALDELKKSILHQAFAGQLQ